MHKSTNSFPSPEKTGDGSCTSTAVPMWTVDPRSRQNINEAHALFDFNQLPVLYDIRASVLFSVFNHSCVSADAE